MAPLLDRLEKRQGLHAADQVLRASDEAVHRDTQKGQTVAERILTAVG